MLHGLNTRELLDSGGDDFKDINSILLANISVGVAVMCETVWQAVWRTQAYSHILPNQTFLAIVVQRLSMGHLKLVCLCSFTKL